MVVVTIWLIVVAHFIIIAIIVQLRFDSSTDVLKIDFGIHY